MNRFAVVGGICASFLLGGALGAAAQDQHQDDRNAQQNRQDKGKPEERQNQNQTRQNTERPAENRQGQERQAPERSNVDRQGQERQNPERPNQNMERQNQDRQPASRPENRQNGHDTYGGRQDQARPEDQRRGQEQARAGGREENRRRISDPDFRAHFGREHHFAPGRMQVYEGRPQFSYGGYIFQLDQPWPSDWAYDEDDCYVDYMDDEYWLFNTRHPGVRLPLTIVG